MRDKTLFGVPTKTYIYIYPKNRLNSFQLILLSSISSIRNQQPIKKTAYFSQPVHTIKVETIREDRSFSIKSRSFSLRCRSIYIICLFLVVPCNCKLKNHKIWHAVTYIYLSTERDYTQKIFCKKPLRKQRKTKRDQIKTDVK